MEFNYKHCPICGSELLEAEMDGEVEGEKVFFDGLYCAGCEDTQATAITEYNAEQAERQFRRNHGLLTPDSIRDIRESLEETPKELSRILGYPNDYWTYWESGTMPTRAQSNLIRLLRRRKNYEFLRALYRETRVKERVKRKLPDVEDDVDVIMMYTEDSISDDTSPF